MCQLFETIRVEGGTALNLPWHQARVDRSLNLCFPGAVPILLEAVLRAQPLPASGLWRCRLVYGPAVSRCDWQPYAMRTIRRLILMEAGDIDYSHKYLDRARLDALRAGLAPWEEPLLIRNGWITDTTFSNVILEIDGRWVTPALPLLQGTRRAALLASGAIVAAPLRPEDLTRCQRLRLINAMLAPGEHPDLYPKDVGSTAGPEGMYEAG